jgi:hypothetical protein
MSLALQVSRQLYFDSRDPGRFRRMLGEHAHNEVGARNPVRLGDENPRKLRLDGQSSGSFLAQLGDLSGPPAVTLIIIMWVDA